MRIFQIQTDCIFFTFSIIPQKASRITSEPAILTLIAFIPDNRLNSDSYNFGTAIAGNHIGTNFAKSISRIYRNDEPMFSISGLLIRAKWDKQGNIIDFAIATRDEEEYILEGHTHRVSLKTLLRQEVEVSGVLEKKGGKKIIKVKKIIKKNLHQSAPNHFSVPGKHYL